MIANSFADSFALEHWDYKKILDLGRHYSYLWAHNNLIQEEEAANPNRDKKNSRSEVSGLLSEADKVNGMADPLTQRLVSAVLEENVYIANDNTGSFYPEIHES